MNVNTSCINSSVYLPIVPVIVNDKCKMFALLDTGSTSTFITQRLASFLNLKSEEVNCKMSILGRCSNLCSHVVSVDIKSVSGEHVLKLTDVFVVPNIPAKYPSSLLDFQKYPYLSDLPIQQVNGETKVDILIGMDNAQIMMQLDVRRAAEGRNKPYAVLTMFGWSLNGPVQHTSASPEYEIASNFVNMDLEIKRLWDIETLDENVQSLSYEDRKVMKLWNEEIYFENGHYFLPIPWSDGCPNFPSNRYLATVRLLARLNKNKMLDIYTEKINQMAFDGYAEPVPVADLGRHDQATRYLPHHADLSESKPGKVRVVLDCAAKQDGVSPNNQCLQGPDLNNKLIHVLLRFRQFKYAVSADIEAVYLQLKIPISDRDALRFFRLKMARLWNTE